MFSWGRPIGSGDPLLASQGQSSPGIFSCSTYHLSSSPVRCRMFTRGLPVRTAKHDLGIKLGHTRIHLEEY